MVTMLLCVVILLIDLCYARSWLLALSVAALCHICEILMLCVVMLIVCLCCSVLIHL